MLTIFCEVLFFELGYSLCSQTRFLPSKWPQVRLYIASLL